MSQCRFCGETLSEKLVDLGSLPLANSLLTEEQLLETEPSYPLSVYVCSKCHLVQLKESKCPEQIFQDYVFFSSFSDTWQKHCEQYAVDMIKRLNLGSSSMVLEIGSNDGCLLEYFMRTDIPVLGVEPAANVVRAAAAKNIPTQTAFFGKELAARLAADGFAADLIAANNVLAHVPDINGFVEGLVKLIKPDGVITVEFPHLLNLIEQTQFDTIYHEHLFYFTLNSVERILSVHGLRVFDVQELPTHGGSLRVYTAQKENSTQPVSTNVETLRQQESALEFNGTDVFRLFQERVNAVKTNLLEFLTETQSSGRTVAGYGAPAKAATLLNFCGIGPELLPYTVDRSPHKQSRFIPGVRIPIFAPEMIMEQKPDYVLILPWNLHQEIIEQMSVIREWGGNFIVPIPQLQIF